MRAGVVVAARDDAENMLSGHLCRRRTEPALAIRPVPSQLLEHTLDQDRADVAPIIGAVRYGSPLSQFGANVVTDMPTKRLVDWLTNDETDLPTGRDKEGCRVIWTR